MRLRGGISDGDLTSSAVTRAVTVTPVNDAPVLGNIDTSVLEVLENDISRLVSPSISVADHDWFFSAAPSEPTATIVLSTPDFAGDSLSWEPSDELSWTSSLVGDRAGALTGGVRFQSYNASTGILVLAGQASSSAWEVALRRVRFSCTAEDPLAGNRSVAFTISRGRIGHWVDIGARLGSECAAGISTAHRLH